MVFGLFFFSRVISLLLSFCDHHFLCSCSAHRLNPCTNFCIHLGHIPPHTPASSLCMLCLVFSPKTLLSTQDTRFLAGHWPLELLVLREWGRLSRWISLCRSPPSPTTLPYYKFADTSLLFCMCAGQCTLLPHPPILGRRRKTPKTSLGAPCLALSSLPPCSPSPSSLLPPFVLHIWWH